MVSKGELQPGYRTIDRRVDRELSLDDYRKGGILSQHDCFLHSRFEPMPISSMSGYQTIQFGADIETSTAPFDLADSPVMMDGNEPVCLLSDDASGCRLHLYIPIKPGNVEAYKKYIDSAGRGGPMVSLSLPFRNRGEALGFSKWLEGDFEARLKQTIATLAPVIAPWSGAWALTEANSDLTKIPMAEAIEEPKDPVSAKTQESRSWFKKLLGR